MTGKKMPVQIAIDGPVGSGKSNIAKRLAHELRYTYIYTGAMYRAFALFCFKKKIAYKDIAQVVPLLADCQIDVLPQGDEDASNLGFTLLLNNEDVTDMLFTPEIDKGSSDVSTIPEVRRFMVARQQQLAEGQSVVMEGRDIGYRVLPDAQVKIYLTASVEERARRRHEDYKKKGIVSTYKDVLEDTKQRDLQDTTRVTDPLKKLPDAIEIDSTGLTQEQVVEKIKLFAMQKISL